MNKPSVARIIIVYFFKTIGILALLVGVGLLSYYLTMLYYKQTDREERATTYQHVIDISAGTESSNLIYSYNENDGKIDAMILELFDQDSKNLTLGTIPANTTVTLSPETYQEMAKVNANIPQSMKLLKMSCAFGMTAKNALTLKTFCLLRLPKPAKNLYL